MTQPPISGLSEMFLAAASDETLQLLGRALAQAIDTTEDHSQLLPLGRYYQAVVYERSARAEAAAKQPPQLSDPAPPNPVMPAVWVGLYGTSGPTWCCQHVITNTGPCPQGCHSPLRWNG